MASATQTDLKHPRIWVFVHNIGINPNEVPESAAPVRTDVQLEKSAKLFIRINLFTSASSGSYS